MCVGALADCSLLTSCLSPILHLTFIELCNGVVENPSHLELIALCGLRIFANVVLIVGFLPYQGFCCVKIENPGRVNFPSSNFPFMVECYLNIPCFMQAPQSFDKSRDTSALFGDCLVIFSHRTASLTLFRLKINPASPAPGDYLPWSKCAMPASPADAPVPVLDTAHGQLKNIRDSSSYLPETPLTVFTAPDAAGVGRINSKQLNSDASSFYQNRVNPADTRIGESIVTGASSAVLGLDTSRLWRQSDFQPVVPGLEQATLKWSICMISCESGHKLPVSSSCWSAMATDAARNRLRYYLQHRIENGSSHSSPCNKYHMRANTR